MNVSKKSSCFKDFRKKAHNPKLPNIYFVIVVIEKAILESEINEIFTAQRYKLNTLFGSNLI